MARSILEWVGLVKVEYEDPVATAIFAPDAEIAALAPERKLDLLLRLAGNGRLTDREFRRFAQACAKRP